MTRRSRVAARRRDRERSRAGSTSDRAVSTVLDVALFLLLVGAAVAVLYAAPDGSGASERADADAAPAVATTLATTTTDVEYQPTAGDETVVDRASVLTLLARAAVASAGHGDDGGIAPRYAAAVTEAVRGELRALERDRRVQVRATWEPLPGSGLRGEVTVGPKPPASADVHAATTTVPLGTARRSGVPAVDWFGHPSGDSALGRVAIRGAAPDLRDVPDDWPVAGGTSPWPVDRREVDAVALGGERADAASADGTSAVTASADAASAAEPDCRAVALTVARRTVGHLFPPEQTGVALRAEQPVDAEGSPAGPVAARYEAVAELAGVDPSEVPRGDAARGTNARLVAALAGSFAPTACDGYEDAAAAAAAASPDEVTVVVRTWSP